MKKIHFLILFLFVLYSCNKNAPEGSLQTFSDDFENWNNAQELIGNSNTQWTETNVNEINISSEPIRIDTVIVHSGKKSIRFECVQENLEEVCKCNLNRGMLDFPQGKTLYYSAWYYIEHPNEHYGTFFPFDLGQIVSGSLEVRIMAWEENLELERNKIGLPNIFQDGNVKLFPVNEWAKIEMELKLSQYETGSVKMWLNEELILDKAHIRTMPKDQINLAYGTKNYYERVQIGITAKNQTPKLVMYVDDVFLGLKN